MSSRSKEYLVLGEITRFTFCILMVIEYVVVSFRNPLSCLMDHVSYLNSRHVVVSEEFPRLFAKNQHRFCRVQHRENYTIAALSPA
jgi:hypothetical protein